jgi:hypothetical protein
MSFFVDSAGGATCHVLIDTFGEFATWNLIALTSAIGRESMIAGTNPSAV